MKFVKALPKTKLVHKWDFLIKKSTNQNVLNLGPVGRVDYPTIPIVELHKEIMEVSNSVVGIDLDKKGIDFAKKEGINNILWGNVEEIENISLNEKFTVIIAGDIIEHLSNPGKFLDGLKKFFSEDTELIISTPNSFCFQRFIPTLILKKETLDPDHTCYFSYNTLATLLERHGYRIKEYYGCTLERFWENIYKIVPHFATGLIFVVCLKE